MGMPLDNFKTLYEKRLLKKLMQILNDPTHPMRHYFDNRRSIRGGRFLLSKTTQTVIRPRFYSLLCQILTKIIKVTNLVCACVKTSAEDDDFQRGEGVFERFYVLVCHITLVRVSFGQLGISF